MFAVNEDFSTYQRTNLDSLLKYSDAATEAAEQWFELNARTAKAGVAEALKQVRALATAKDVQELTSLQTGFSQANAEKLLGFARAVYGWATETQGELTKLAEAQIAEINRSLAAAVDKAAKSAPTGSEFAFAAIKQAMSATNQALDAVSKASKQVGDIAEATVSATTGGLPAKKNSATA
jgi:phasin family protein